MRLLTTYSPCTYPPPTHRAPTPRAKAHELTLDAALATLQRSHHRGGLKSAKGLSRSGVEKLWRSCQPFAAPSGTGRASGHSLGHLWSPSRLAGRDEQAPTYYGSTYYGSR